MVRHGAAATADDAHTRITGQHGIIGHQIGRAVIMDMAVMVFGDPGVAFGDDRSRGALGHKSQHRAHQIGRADAAVRTKGQRRVWQFFDHIGHRGRGDAHHGAACGIKAHRAAPGHAGQCCGLGGGAVFFGGGHGFNPQNIGAACLQAFGLFVEHFNRKRMGQRTDGHHNFTRRTDRACHDDRTPGSIGNFTPQACGDAVQFMHAVLQIVQFHPAGVAAKRIGQKQV